MSTSKLSTLGANLREVRNEAEKNAKQYIKEAVEAFFEKNPTVMGFRWNQYIPGFNDGSPCLFTLGCVWLKTDAEFTEEEMEEFDGTYAFEDGFINLDECRNGDDTYTKGLTKELVDEAYDIWNGLAAIGDTLGEIFEHNATITVERGSDVFDVEEYDCGY